MDRESGGSFGEWREHMKVIRGSTTHRTYKGIGRVTHLVAYLNLFKLSSYYCFYLLP